MCNMYMHIYSYIYRYTFRNDSLSERQEDNSPTEFFVQHRKKKKLATKAEGIVWGGVTEFGTGGYFGNCGLFICFEL